MAGFILARGLLARGRQVYQGKVGETKCYFRTMSQFTFLEREAISLNIKPNAHCIDPYSAVEDDLKDTFNNIKMELKSSDKHLISAIRYHFDGQSKLRPAIILLMAKALNNHIHGYESILLPQQRQVAMIAEMLHTAFHLHDVTGVSDSSKVTSESLSQLGDKAILIGDYILSLTLLLMSRIGNNDGYAALCKILCDQVQGGLMQDGKSTMMIKDESISQYLTTTFNTTASLIANSCQAVAIIAGAESNIQDLAFQFGKNAGISFQIADDITKLMSEHNESQMIESDGQLQVPWIHATEVTDWIEYRRFLARHHCENAIQILEGLRNCLEKRALVSITNGFLNDGSHNVEKARIRC